MKCSDKAEGYNVSFVGRRVLRVIKRTAVANVDNMYTLPICNLNDC